MLPSIVGTSKGLKKRPEPMAAKSADGLSNWLKWGNSPSGPVNPAELVAVLGNLSSWLLK